MKNESRQLHAVYKKMLEYGNQKTARDRLDDVLKPLNEVTQNRMCTAVDDLIEERLESERHNHSRASVTSVNANATNDNMWLHNNATSTVATSNHNSIPTTNVHPQFTTNESANEKIDLTDRHTLKRNYGEARLCVILDINENYHQLSEIDKKHLTEGSKTFVRQSMTPIINCFKDCCNHDANVFLEKNGHKFSYSKFKCKH